MLHNSFKLGLYAVLISAAAIGHVEGRACAQAITLPFTDSNPVPRPLPPVSPVQQAPTQQAPVQQASLQFGAAPPQTLPPQQTPPLESLAPPPPVPVAPEQKRMALADFESIAMGNNPTLMQASARVGSLRGTWTQAGLYPNPRLTYRGDEMGDENRSGFQGTSVTQEIVTKHKLALAQDIVSQQIRQANNDYSAQALRVQNDVKIRFYEVLLAQRAVELAQELGALTRRSAEVADDLFRATQVARTDVLQARVEADTVQLQLIRAQNFHQSSWRRLATVVGVPNLAFTPLAGDIHDDIPVVDWDQSCARLLATSPELAAAQAKLSAARASVQKAYADRCPNFDLEGGYSHDNITGFDTGNISVSVPVPIFNRNQGAIRQTQSDVTAAQGEVERMALELRNRLALVFERYANARAMVDRYEQSILPNAKESAELTGKRYQAGDINYTALLVAQRTYLQTQVAYLDAVRELRETTVLIDGLLLSDSLPSLK
jgi:cobalt-zinc-cadmium efflux system outer membrane protein